MIPVTEHIHQSLVSLHTARALESLDLVLSRLEKGAMTAIEAIDALLAEELSLSEGRCVGVGLRTALLTPIKTLESFDFSFQISLDRHRITALAQLEFINRAEVLHLHGPPGTGKSQQAMALGVAAVKAGPSVYRCRVAELMNALAQTERQGRQPDQILFHALFSPLIVAEIGYQPITKGGTTKLFQLVNAHYEKGAMILTANCGFAELPGKSTYPRCSDSNRRPSTEGWH
jgi:DNA replication protein DnaC